MKKITKYSSVLLVVVKEEDNTVAEKSQATSEVNWTYLYRQQDQAQKQYGTVPV